MPPPELPVSSSAREPQHTADADANAQTLLDSLIRDFLHRLPDGAAILRELLHALAIQPERVAEIQQRYYKEHLALWTGLLVSGSPTPEAAPQETPDPRFASPEWRTVPWFDYLRRSYLVNTRWVNELLDAIQLADAKKRRVAFVLRQYLDAIAPTNFAASNPDVIRLATQSKGASLTQGFKLLSEDVTHGRIRMTDESAFEVGRNIAVTPGAVVYQNEIVELIQYTPRTEQVYSRPLFIVPPFINKYYILDLQPENSFVRYALDRGFQVFLVSWRNVPRELGSSTWEDYMSQGVYAPLEAIREITACDQINALGFCVGGTLLASALAVMQDQQRVASLTLLAAMLDFDDVGEIGVYIDEEYVAQCEQTYRDGGLMPGSVLTSTFASLRANELVWFFVINNYLKGQTPRAFDLLYWNSDSANLPGRLYAWYLRNAYLENNLRVPGKVALFGRPLDLRAIDCPTFVLATREDHIVPWRSAYASTQLLGGRIEFVLGASGHIAGVVNPPAPVRRSHWLNPGFVPANPDEWLQQATDTPGSWWPHWVSWLTRTSGTQIPAPQTLGSVRHPVCRSAPGEYVRDRNP